MSISVLDLDPSDSRNEAAILGFLEQRLDEGCEAFARRVAVEGASDVLQAQAELTVACIVQRRGNDSEVERLFSDGLRRVWGSGTLGEFRGCVNYALSCLLRRRVFEALVLARRACDLARDLKNEFGRAIAQGHLVGVLIEMRDLDRAETCLAEMEEMVKSVPAERRDLADRRAVSYRLELAFHRNDGASALRALARLEELPASADPRAGPWCRALALACNGRHGDALIELRTARPRQPVPDRHDYEFDLLEIACLAQTAPADAIVAACSFLDRLRRADVVTLSSGRRLALAEQVGRLLLEKLPARDVATIAFDVAGAAALERMGELERFLRDLPELHENYMADHDVLTDYRARFAAEHRELLDVIAGLLRDSPGRLLTFGGADVEFDDLRLRVVPPRSRPRGPLDRCRLVHSAGRRASRDSRRLPRLPRPHRRWAPKALRRAGDSLTAARPYHARAQWCAGPRRGGRRGMIKGVHALLYSKDAAATRTFLRDKLQLPCSDVGDGWLIFDFQEGDMGCHPTWEQHPETNHEVSFYCDDITGTVAELKGRGVEFKGDVEDRGWGLATEMLVPGGPVVTLYEPRYKKG